MRPVPADQDLTLQEIFALVHKDLARVEIALHEMVKSASPIVEEINSYVHNSGGKRLRPTLALLCCNMFGYNGSPAIRLGVILELIHVATLVHDDIIDGASIRRNLATANAKWGNNLTVLLGDCLIPAALDRVSPAIYARPSFDSVPRRRRLSGFGK